MAEYDKKLKGDSGENAKLLNEVDIAAAVREFVGYYERNYGAIDYASENRPLKKAIFDSPDVVKKATGLEPQEFFDRVIDLVRPKDMLVEKFTGVNFSPSQSKTVQQMIDTTKQVLSQDIRTSNNDVMDKLVKMTGVGKSYLMKEFLTETSTRYSDLISQIRFEKAVEILAQEENIVNREKCEDIAIQTGMGSTYNVINRRFKEFTGMGVVEYQKNVLGVVENDLVVSYDGLN